MPHHGGGQRGPVIATEPRDSRRCQITQSLDFPRYVHGLLDIGLVSGRISKASQLVLGCECGGQCTAQRTIDLRKKKRKRKKKSRAQSWESQSQSQTQTALERFKEIISNEHKLIGDNTGSVTSDVASGSSNSLQDVRTPRRSTPGPLVRNSTLTLHETRTESSAIDPLSQVSLPGVLCPASRIPYFPRRVFHATVLESPKRIKPC